MSGGDFVLEPKKALAIRCWDGKTDAGVVCLDGLEPSVIDTAGMRKTYTFGGG